MDSPVPRIGFVGFLLILTVASGCGGIAGPDGGLIRVQQNILASIDISLQNCVLHENGTPICWGGTGSPILPGGGVIRLVTISGGWSHACGIAADSIAYCWGSNSHGELGDGTSIPRSGADLHRVTPVASPLQFVAIAAAVHSTCALDGTGRAYCWGKNDYGALGNGAMTEGGIQTTPAPVQGSRRFRDISSGSYSMCAIAFDDRVWCWGMVPGSFDPAHYRPPGDCRDRYYVWYQGTSCLRPTQLAGNLRFEMQDGGNCGITTDGHTYCWGDGFSGQLGNGRLGFYSVEPVPVSGGLSFTQVASGGIYVCALTAAGEAYCWGHNGGGQLGNGQEADGYYFPVSPVPVRVATDRRFVAITAGGNTCGLTADRAVWCWGPGYGAVPVQIQLP
jgi:alpha-tubulin suppressor-like RCC1 family protein